MPKSYFSFKNIVKLNVNKIRYKVFKSYIFSIKLKIKTNKYIASIDKNL